MYKAHARLLNSVLFSLVFSLFTLVWPTVSQAATYYVSPTGNDSNSGTTEAQAWRNPARAGQTAQAGDTVMIAPGTYGAVNGNGYILQPQRSGTASQPITFRALNSTRPVFTGANSCPAMIDLTDRQYIVIDGLELRDPCNQWGRWLSLSNSHHNVINNTRFVVTGTSQGVDWTGINFENSTYNRLSNCHVDGWGIYGDPYNNGGDAIQLNGASHHNIIENCFIGAGGHAGLQLDGGDTYFNVIRNNTFQNQLEKGFETTQRRPGRFEYNLFEGNTCVQAGYNSEYHGGMCLHINANRNIIRRNVLRGALGWGIDVQTWGTETLNNINNHIFHNTIVNNGLDQAGWNAYMGYPMEMTGIEVTDFGYTGAPHRDQRIKNNILYDNKPEIGFNPQRKVALKVGYDSGTPPFNGIQVAGNLMYSNAAGEQNIQVNGVGINTVAWFNQNHASFFWGNISQAPVFQAYNQGTANNPLDGTFDLQLQAGSPGVDQGVNLTQTTAAGNGTVITVQDAGYFQDGFDGIISPDQIRVGNELVTITSIDYTNNRITINRSISWSANTGVNLPFNGNNPDIGAFESTGTGSGTSPSTSPSAAASPSVSPSPSPSPSAVPSVSPSPSPSPNVACRQADINNDGIVNAADRDLLLSDFFKTLPANGGSDINVSGRVDLTDYGMLARVYGQQCQ